MNYSSPFCPDDANIITKNGKMKISKLYYKMNPKRDPYNKIIDIQNFFLSKCVSNNKDNKFEKKLQNPKSLKELKIINNCYNNINKNDKPIIINPEDLPYFNDDSSNIFQTALQIGNKTNYKNINIEKYKTGIYQTNDNSKFSTNFIDSSLNDQSYKQRTLNQSHPYVIKLDKTYYKSPTVHRKIYILNNKNKREIDKNQQLFRTNDISSVIFNDSDMSKYSEIIPLSRQNYLNEQFDFDNCKKNTLTYLKQYQMKETQNKAKIKPFSY